MKRDQQVKRGDSASLLSRDSTWSTVSSSGAPSARRTWSCWSMSRGGPQRWWEIWSTSPMKSGWENCNSSACGRESSMGTLQRPFSTQRGPSGKLRRDFFIRAGRDRASGNGFKLEEGRFRLDIRKKFFSVRVVRYWNRLASDTVDA